MATPIDLDGEIYGDPIGQATVINRPKRTWWGKRKAILPAPEPKIWNLFSVNDQRRMAGMTYTKHGHHIDGTVRTNQPNAVADCGGPKVCVPCGIDAASYKPYPEGTMLIWDVDAHDRHLPGQGAANGCGFCLRSVEPEDLSLNRELDFSMSQGRISGPVFGKDPIHIGDQDYPRKAKDIVIKYVDAQYTRSGARPPAYETYLVWFCKTLQHWKALVGTTLEDNEYYEVIYNGDKRETYLHPYSKTAEIVIPD